MTVGPLCFEEMLGGKGRDNVALAPHELKQKVRKATQVPPNSLPTFKSFLTGRSTMNTDKTAARIVKGLVTIRNAVAKLDTAHVNGRSYEAQSALNTIDDEYFFIRECLDELVEQTHYSVK